MIKGILYDSEDLGGRIWIAAMPYKEWQRALPAGAFYRPDIRKNRITGAIIGTLFLAVLAYVIGGVAGSAIGVVAACLTAPIGGLAGWFMGPGFLGENPIVVARREADGNATKLLPIAVHEESDVRHKALTSKTFHIDLQTKTVSAIYAPPASLMDKLQAGLPFLQAGGCVALLAVIYIVVGGA